MAVTKGPQDDPYASEKRTLLVAPLHTKYQLLKVASSLCLPVAAQAAA